MPTNPNLLVSPKQRHGSYFEQMALAYLQQQGLQLLAQNWQQPKVGELDLVMRHFAQGCDVLVFVEVRKRKIAGFGDALASITPSKQRKLIKTAQYFLQQHPNYANFDCRFDVVGFDVVPPTRVTGSPIRGQGRCQSPQITAQQTTAAPEAGTLVNDNQQSLVPQWLQGAFMASAW